MCSVRAVSKWCTGAWKYKDTETHKDLSFSRKPASDQQATGGLPVSTSGPWLNVMVAATKHSLCWARKSVGLHFSENKESGWVEWIVHCKLNEGDWSPPSLFNKGSQPCQKNCQRSFPPCNSKCHLVMATTVSSYHPFSPRSPSLQFAAFFCPCKVILQVKAGHLEACGLAVACCVVSPYSKPVPAPGTEAQGLSRRRVAGVQHRLAMFNIPSSRQRLPCIYCQKQLALPLMADYFVQVISFQFWARTKFVRGNKLRDIFFGCFIGSLCHRVCVYSCE